MIGQGKLHRAQEKITMFIIILMLSSVAHGRHWKNDKIQRNFKKEKVQEPLCEEIVGYKFAALPNFFLQQNQAQILDDRFFQAFGRCISTSFYEEKIAWKYMALDRVFRYH